MARIYVETTIPSFSYDIRSAAEMVARRNWTRRWFDAARQSSDKLVTSLAVEAELRNGDSPSRPEALALIAGLPLLDRDEAVAEVVDAYISRINTMLGIGCPVLITPLDLFHEGINNG